ncbi:hypothetical protein Y1Q_0000905 [Alligator mississippiensis]|uniref:Uncharacterized protein n=1 Tax=Alligator mississippiensis TaxID=8496 RepID=A0A151NDV5_ALLMI|nr:hypothetical protein Y1Q_0000905 [Alligator mississippiensis]
MAVVASKQEMESDMKIRKESLETDGECAKAKKKDNEGDGSSNESSSDDRGSNKKGDREKNEVRGKTGAEENGR